MSASKGEPPALVLFRNDLRVADNGALWAASQTDKPVLAVYIHGEEGKGFRAHGGASLWWRHHSLKALDTKLRNLGIRFVLQRGTTRRIVDELIERTGADAVFWNRRYEPACVTADTAMKGALRERGVRAESFDGELLHEPSKLLTGAGSFYKVYTPFWKSLTSGPDPRDPIDPPTSLAAYSGKVFSIRLDDLVPLPAKPDWAGGMRESWMPGEDGAQALLDEFLKDGLDGYADGRDFPGRSATSRLSPHLAHGEITPHQLFAALRERKIAASGDDVAKFRKEIAWREFCRHLLFHNPNLHDRNVQPSFDAFPWVTDETALRAWQRGMTGYPIVDAGMRELWHTGTMHNRVRMIAASFLTKHLMMDWREGERWFWDTLVDADPGSNPANWQWVAGSGADAAPYFRIFNPTLQGQKFDPDGVYVRRFVPELAALPDRYLHTPWDAPKSVLSDAGVTLGETYPTPIVDHARARARALAAYRSIRNAA